MDDGTRVAIEALVKNALILRCCGNCDHKNVNKDEFMCVPPEFHLFCRLHKESVCGADFCDKWNYDNACPENRHKKFANY